MPHSVFFKDASGCSRSVKAAGIYTQGALQCLRPDAPGYGRLGRRVCHSQLSVISLSAVCLLPSIPPSSRVRWLSHP